MGLEKRNPSQSGKAERRKQASALQIERSDKMTEQFTFPPLYQLGYVVGDIEKACRYYESTFGIGPFSPPMEVDMTGAILRGKAVETTIKVSFAQLGEVQIEFIQPVEGENPYFEFLAKNGDGIHHLAFETDNMAAAKAHFAEKGIEPVYHQDMGFMEFAYFDTSEVGGTMVEFIDWRKR
jgi:catechol 2,3-dioxygenase-like lactoylglutathione lyase family enzyme